MSEAIVFKFAVGQRVAIREGHFGYLKGGQTGVVKSAVVLNDLPEYLVEIDDGEYSNVAGWFLREHDLVAAPETAKYVITMWGEDAASVTLELTEAEAKVVAYVVDAFSKVPQPDYSPSIDMEREA